MRQKRKDNPVLEKYYVEQGSKCYYCHNKILFQDVTRDHLIPKAKGGTLLNNSVFSCRKCNVCKGAKTMEEFRDWIIEELKDILRVIVGHKFKATQSQVDKFKHKHRMLMSVVGVINNNYKPKFD